MTTPSHSRRGFTLLELMVSVLVGAIVIMGVYSIYGVATRGYRIQDQALQAMSNLRTGLHQLRADLRYERAQGTGEPHARSGHHGART